MALFRAAAILPMLVSIATESVALASKYSRRVSVESVAHLAALLGRRLRRGLVRGRGRDRVRGRGRGRGRGRVRVRRKPGG